MGVKNKKSFSHDMKQNLVTGHQYIFFRSARVILDDNLFLRLLQQKKYSFLVAISHNVLDVTASVIVKRKKTSLISLRRNTEEILQSFHDTTRNEIRRTFTRPELSFTLNDDRFNEAYDMYKDFRREKNLEIKPSSFLRSALRFSAYLRGQLLSVVTCYDAEPYLRIQNIFSAVSKDKETQKYTGNATRRLVYEVCKYGNEWGRSALDMASINLHNPAKNGITNFKLSFGGTIVDEYTYTYKSPFVHSLGFMRRWATSFQYILDKGHIWK